MLCLRLVKVMLGMVQMFAITALHHRCWHTVEETWLFLVILIDKTLSHLISIDLNRTIIIVLLVLTKQINWVTGNSLVMQLTSLLNVFPQSLLWCIISSSFVIMVWNGLLIEIIVHFVALNDLLRRWGHLPQMLLRRAAWRPRKWWLRWVLVSAVEIFVA